MSLSSLSTGDDTSGHSVESMYHSDSAMSGYLAYSKFLGMVTVRGLPVSAAPTRPAILHGPRSAGGDFLVCAPQQISTRPRVARVARLAAANSESGSLLEG